jgi:hypothetical protein
MVVTRRDRRELATLARGNTHFDSDACERISDLELARGASGLSEAAFHWACILRRASRESQKRGNGRHVVRVLGVNVRFDRKHIRRMKY